MWVIHTRKSVSQVHDFSLIYHQEGYVLFNSPYLFLNYLGSFRKQNNNNNKTESKGAVTIFKDVWEIVPPICKTNPRGFPHALGAMVLRPEPIREKGLHFFSCLSSEGLGESKRANRHTLLFTIPFTSHWVIWVSACGKFREWQRYEPQKKPFFWTKLTAHKASYQIPKGRGQAGL